MEKIKQFFNLCVDNWKVFLIIICSLIFIVGCVLAILIFSDNIDGWYGLENPYKFSGILSGAFAALAFLGVLISLILQVIDSKRQKKVTELQRFENTFFQMMNLQQEIVRGLSFEYLHMKNEEGCSVVDYDPVSGRECFEILYNEAVIGIPHIDSFWKIYKELEESGIYSEKIYHGLSKGNPTISVFGGISQVLNLFGFSGYEKAYELPVFDHYFRHLYRIVKFIDESSFIEKSPTETIERYKYASMIRALLSPYELVCIYYNCLSSYGNTKFKILIEKYSLLKNLRTDLLTYSKEYNDSLDGNEIYKINQFPENDYEFYLNIDENNRNEENYYLSASIRDEEEFSKWKSYYESLASGASRKDAAEVFH